MGRKVTEEEVREWVALHEKGHTYDDIGEKAGRRGETVGKHVREYLKRKGGQGSPEAHPDSELEDLERKKKRLKAWMELETLKQAMMKVPQRLDELQATVEVLGADQDLLRERIESSPIANLGRKWKCRGCGSSKYVMVKVKCNRCGRETEWGHVCPPEEKVYPPLPVS